METTEKRLPENATELPSFTKGGKILSLRDIINNKKIISVTVTYLSQKRKVKAPGFRGFLGAKEDFQELKELTIEDQKGISFNFKDGNEFAKIRFYKKREFDKVKNDEDYDCSTFWRQYDFSREMSFQINFLIRNLKDIDWV